MSSAGPIVKWAGGKTRLLRQLLSRMPRTFGRYYEPFVGGGALFFALNPSKAALGDTNDALIETYQAVAENVQAVIDRLEIHKIEHGIDGHYYYEIRDLWNKRRRELDVIDRASVFLYLNKTCFNGLWRVRRDGGFNVPKGDYKNPTIFDPASLRASAEVLARARLVTGEYAATTADAVEGDFVYFDPPYDPVSKTSNFTSYTKDAFGKQQQTELAEHAQELSKRGVRVMLSNNDTPFVRSLYEDFHVDNVKCGRSINSNGSKRGAVDEVVITSYDPKKIAIRTEAVG